MERFSRNTLLVIIDAFNFQTRDEVDRFVWKFEIENAVSGQYLNQKKTSIAKYLYANQEKLGPNGSRIIIEIVEYLVSRFGEPSQLELNFPELVNALRKDGFEISDLGLRKILPEILPIVEKEERLIELLKKFNFKTALGHYQNSIAAHSRGEWSPANGQLRDFVEEVFTKIQETLCLNQCKNFNERMDALAKCGFFKKEYNEYLSNGKGFVEGFWKRLHPQGSHPGLSEEFDSTFRLHLVILVIQYFLTRFNMTIPPN